LHFDDGLQENDQQLESGSSVDGGTETSDDGIGGSVERVTPCSNVTRSSSVGPAISDKVSTTRQRNVRKIETFLVLLS